jgi:hypothetical protein
MNKINIEQEKKEVAARRVAPFYTKTNKKRVLPDVFYLRWEIELLSAFILILMLFLIPGWTSSILHALLPESTMATSFIRITFITRILIFGFGIYIILRFVWLILIGKQESVSHGRLRFIKEIDQVAELIISICIIFLVIGLFAFIIRLLIIWMQNEILNKTGDVFKMNL